VAFRDDALARWAALDAPWRDCLRLAWEAYGARTIPVGAVLVDGAGEVVARGRNHVYETGGAPGAVAGSRLAHAEVNALVALTPDRRYDDHTLYTSLEPCLLCVGAAVMTTVGQILYLGADRYGGGDGAIHSNAHVERVGMTIAGPRSDGFGRLAEALHVAFFVERDRGSSVAAAYRERAPEVVATGQALLVAGLRRLADGPLDDALPELWPAVA
jgi:tRNA(Arg) A34 adenosine deaminase TadA